MKKREFLELLAVGGAVPLTVAGCGGNGSGSTNLRLVNASVGYPNLGLLVDTTQATSTDVAYGTASPFAGVPAGSVTTTLTTTTNGVVTDLPAVTRTLNKDVRYTLVAYGFSNEPKSVLILENQSAPDAGNASFNVLNTSTDVGAVDIYLLSSGQDLTDAAPIVSSITGVSQSTFAQITAGTYTAVVVGAGSVQSGTTDVRLTVTGVALADQQIATLILTPGASGVLANGMLLTQAADGTITNYPNTLCRVRAVGSTGLTGTISVAAGGQALMTNVPSPNFTGYVNVTAGGKPIAQVDGGDVTVIVGPGQTMTDTTLAAGSDYTIVVYGEVSAPVAELFLDDNRLPASNTGVKVRLLNAVLSTTNTSLPLTLNVNATSVATDIIEGAMSPYAEVPALAQSIVSVNSGFTLVVPNDGVNTGVTYTLSSGNIYTMVVAGEGTTSDVTGIRYNFSGARR
jgi:hypothetical protein